MFARREDVNSGIVARVYVSGESSPILEFPGDAEFAWSAAGRHFVVALPRAETPAERVLRRRRRISLPWKCSVFDANFQEMGGSVVETEGKPEMALSVDGLTFAVCDEKSETRLRAWRLGVSNAYLEETCKQCEEPGHEDFDEYCKDSISLNPLRKISHLYKTPAEKGGDDTCWNTDISLRGVERHPTTGKDFTVERFYLPPPSVLRLHHEGILNITSPVLSVVVCGKGHGEATVAMALEDGTTRVKSMVL